MKCLVIGDCHFDNPYKGYLKSQVDTLYTIILKRKPSVIVFLGDIFHHRKPEPEVIIEVFKFFKRISLIPPVSEIYVLRGNHDSANKSDDGISALSILTYPASKVTVVLDYLYVPHLNFSFIPHFEEEARILRSLEIAAHEHTSVSIHRGMSPVVFGHFGFVGNINSIGVYDSLLPIEKFKNRTILGHIHQYKEEENITIIGTPWSTNFGETDYPHYVGEMVRIDYVWEDLDLIEVTHGPRYYKLPYASLESMASEVMDPKYFTILRVIIDGFATDQSTDLRASIMEKYKVAFVELKLQAIFDRVINDRISDYVPLETLDSISDDIVDKYLEEQRSTIPIEKLKEGLVRINSYEDQVD